VLAFLDRVRRLSKTEGDRIRHEYVFRESPMEEGGMTRAAVTLAVIDAAVRAGLKDAHRKAIEDARRILAGSRASGAGMGVHIGDLAGSIVVRDHLEERDFDFLASGWRAALEDDELQ
jgi:hypothetical protein